MSDLIHLTATIDEAHHGMRLDQALAALFPDYSRSKLTQWIKAGQVTVDGQVVKPKEKVSLGQGIILSATPEVATTWTAEAMALDIIYEDDDILVVNKPIDMVVHPAAGNEEGTLVNALLHHVPSLELLPRAGLIHRIDKDTSGLLVVAKTLPAHTQLVQALQAREFDREYEAIVSGVMTGGGTVEAAIGRHPKNRIKMAVVANGKPAVTHYRVIQRFQAHTHVSVKLETGRTHQIRVHMAHINYPIVGDQLYGGRARLPADISEALKTRLISFKRQALHAKRLGLEHPIQKTHMQWEAPLPEDIQQLLQTLMENDTTQS